ncbi:MAG: hypothetical protein GOU98_00035 [Candidatus Altiarchaeota archaeon]|nr:hypothetical protein [Candidatus Altiarchaeota archaeon]
MVKINATYILTSHAFNDESNLAGNLDVVGSSIIGATQTPKVLIGSASGSAVFEKEVELLRNHLDSFDLKNSDVSIIDLEALTDEVYAKTIMGSYSDVFDGDISPLQIGPSRNLGTQALTGLGEQYHILVLDDGMTPPPQLEASINYELRNLSDGVKDGSFVIRFPTLVGVQDGGSRGLTTNNSYLNPEDAWDVLSERFYPVDYLNGPDNFAPSAELKQHPLNYMGGRHLVPVSKDVALEIQYPLSVNEDLFPGNFIDVPSIPLSSANPIRQYKGSDAWDQIEKNDVFGRFAVYGSKFVGEGCFANDWDFSGLTRLGEKFIWGSDELGIGGKHFLAHGDYLKNVDEISDVVSKWTDQYSVVLTKK